MFSARAGAQTPDTATIQGQVTDSDYAAIVGAHIRVVNTISTFTRTAKTNAVGRYSIVELPVGGEYIVTADKIGLAEAQSAPVTLAGGVTAQINFQLHVAARATEVTVKGTVGQTRIDEPQLGERLGARQIEQTPLLGRKITYLPLLNAANRPAINQGDVFMNENLFTTNGSGRGVRSRDLRNAVLGARLNWWHVHLRHLSIRAVDEPSIEANDVLSAAWRQHQIRFGADVIVAHSGGDSKEFGGPIYDGQLLYNTCTGPLAYCESAAYLNDVTNVRSYTQSYGNASYTVNDTLWTVFVQDD